LEGNHFKFEIGRRIDRIEEMMTCVIDKEEDKKGAMLLLIFTEDTT